MNLETYYFGVISGKEKGLVAACLRLKLLVLSWLYLVAVVIRNVLYERGMFPRTKLPATVVSLGNITAGGTGKTPAVIKIAREWQEKGKKVAVLSRGYGRKRRGKTSARVRLVSDGQRTLLSPTEAGDEPYLLAGRLPGIPIVVGNSRVECGYFALGLGVEVLILDDGFQHRALERDEEVVVIDATRPFGFDHLLPRGLLREPLTSLRRANTFLITRVDQASDLSQTRQRIEQLNSGARLLFSVHRPVALMDAATSEKRELSALLGTKVVSLCSIGNPDAFERTLLDQGAVIVHTRRFPDHHLYSDQDLCEIGRSAVEEGADFIVTTEKDAVRLPENVELDVPLIVLLVELEFVHESTIPPQ